MTKIHKITNHSLNILRDRIIEANKAYRLGRPTVSDQEFEDCCFQVGHFQGAYEYLHSAISDWRPLVR